MSLRQKLRWYGRIQPFDRPAPEELNSLPAGIRVLNLQCRDISKERVAEVFEAVFNQTLSIDPTSYSERCVVKSNGNGVHNGRVIQCPVDRIDPESVYQRLIDNQVEINGRQMVLDLRVIICGNQIPLVYRKYRPLEDRFSNTNSLAEVATGRECFSKQELLDIVRFGKEFGVDYAEIDVLRDRASGQIYVVDVNYTPSGPPNHLPTRQGIKAIEAVALAFAGEFLR